MLDEILNSLHLGDDGNLSSLSDGDLSAGVDEQMSNVINDDLSSIQVSSSIEQIYDLSSNESNCYNTLDETVNSADYFPSDSALDDNLISPFSDTDNHSINFDSINKGFIEPSSGYAELNHSEILEPKTECLSFKKEELDISPTTTIGMSNISFGNLYDDRTADFLKECDRLGIDLPSSVTHGESYIDRSCNGGLVEIDKALIRNPLKDALDSGKISKDQFEKLNNKLSSC